MTKNCYLDFDDQMASGMTEELRDQTDTFVPEIVLLHNTAAQKK